MSEGMYPKENGQIFYGQDANMSYYQATLSTNANYGSVNVETMETQIVSENTSRKKILIRNIGTNVVYIGGNDVSSNDLTLSPNTCLVLNVKSSIYGISNSGTNNVRFIEVI